MAFLDQLRARMLAEGMQPPESIPIGKYARFPGYEKSYGNTAGWVYVFPDGLGAIYGDFSTGLRETFQAERDHPYNAAEREAFAKQCREARERAEADERKRREEAQKTVADLLPQSKPASADHGYLVAKGIKPGRFRIFTGRLELRGVECHGALMAILLDEQRVPSAVQFITADGTKRYLGPTHGLYHPIGRPEDGQPLLVCEGIATGYTLYEVTGYAVACAMDAGNLERVARMCRQREPNRKIIVCADDDWTTKDPRTGELNNVGLKAATAAARAIGGLLAVPDFAGVAQ